MTRARPENGGPKRGAPLLLLLLLLAPPLLAPAAPLPPDPAPPKPGAPVVSTGLTEKVTVSLVLIEAVPVDRAGRHVRGLKREEFTVKEDGQVVPIESFDEIDLVGSPIPEAAAKTEAGPSSPPPAASPDRPPAEAPKTAAAPRGIAKRQESQRRFVLVFDGYNNTSALRLVQARRAAKEFLRTRMGPTDSAAVYEMSPFLRAITFFTSDPGGLDEALEQIRYFGGESLGDQITDNALRTGLIGSSADIQNRLLTQAQFGASQNAASRREFYIGLQSLAETLESVPGRKTLVLFSGGFPMAPSRDEAADMGFTLEFRKAIRALERARVSIYGMDIGEEKVLGDASAGASDGSIADQLGLPADFLEQMGRGMGPGGNSVSAQNQIVAVLSNESGGRFVGGRDYRRSLEAMDDDTRHYYLIGWRPPELEGAAGAAARPRRERYRAIDVSVSRPGVRILARRGRYDWSKDAPAPDSAAAVPARAASRPAAAPARGEEGVRLLCVPVAFSGREGKGLLSLPLLLLGRVNPIASGGGTSLDVSTRIVARAGGLEIARKERSYRISGKPEMQEALRDGLRLTEAIELAPGRYEVEAWMRLNGLDVEASWNGATSVPDFASSGLRVSGLMVSGETTRLPPLVADVFTASDAGDAGSDRPGDDPFKLANGWRVAGDSSAILDSAKPVTLFFRVYHVVTDPATGAPSGLSLEYVLVPADGSGEIVPPAQVVYFKKALERGAFDAVTRLDLSGVGDGSYTLRVDASHKGASIVSHQERALRVGRPSKPLDSSK